MDKLPKFLGIQEVAEVLGWHKAKVSTYLTRDKESGFTKGLIPQPVTYVGNRPLWTEEQIKKFKKTLTKGSQKTYEKL